MTVNVPRFRELGCSLLVSEPEIRQTPLGDHVYQFSLSLLRPGGRTQFLHGVTYRSSHPIRPLSGAGNVALASTLVPAMALGLPLRIDAPVSPRLLAGVERFQEIFHCWFPPYTRVSVTAPLATPVVAATGRTAAYFSAGVDGFHTLRTHLSSLSTLVFMHGFDVDLDRVGHRLLAETLVADVAADLRRDLVVLQTDVRAFSDRYAWWGDYCGSALAAGALLLEGHIDRLLVASSTAYGDILPFGTTALTDPLFSTEGVAIEQDGGMHTRIDKVFELAGWTYALERLRVCWTMQAGRLNCCACDKCLRTMTSLWLAGALERAPTFPEPLDPVRIDHYRVSPAHAWYVRENLARAAELGLEHAPVMRAWRRALERADAPAEALSRAALDAAVADEPLRAVWARRHAAALVSDLGRAAPQALHDALERHAPHVLEEALLRTSTQQAPAFWRALARRTVRPRPRR